MNLILLFDPDFITANRVRLIGRRFVHIRDILKADACQSLTVGKVNGLVGQGMVISKNEDNVELEINLESLPPPALPVTLVLALPRPPMLKRILFSAAMLGIKKIIILNFNRVEKSLWNSSSLKPDVMEEQLMLGLEQAKDTVMPEVVLRKGFKAFVQDELPGMIKGKLALVAHPGRIDAVIPVNDVLPASAGTLNQPIILVIGPEGGIIDYEIDLLKVAGCQAIGLGPRILRTDNVLPYFVGAVEKKLLF